VVLEWRERSSDLSNVEQCTKFIPTLIEYWTLKGHLYTWAVVTSGPNVLRIEAYGRQKRQDQDES